MTVNFLEDCSTQLASQVESADASTKRAISLAVCKWAVERTIPDDANVQSALVALEKGSYGERRLMAVLQDHVNDLDQVYFEAQEAKRDFRPLFVKARVANAVLFALDPDPFRAVTYSLYELCAALGTDLVKAEVDRAVGAPPADH
jgi:hypothetical protein